VLPCAAATSVMCLISPLNNTQPLVRMPDNATPFVLGAAVPQLSRCGVPDHSLLCAASRPQPASQDVLRLVLSQEHQQAPDRALRAAQQPGTQRRRMSGAWQWRAPSQAQLPRKRARAVARATCGWAAQTGGRRLSRQLGCGTREGSAAELLLRADLRPRCRRRAQARPGARQAARRAAAAGAEGVCRKSGAMPSRSMSVRAGVRYLPTVSTRPEASPSSYTLWIRPLPYVLTARARPRRRAARRWA